MVVYNKFFTLSLLISSILFQFSRQEFVLTKYERMGVFKSTANVVQTSKDQRYVFSLKESGKFAYIENILNIV